MKRIQTALKGVTTASSYEDGDMYSLVNLRRKGGLLHPVAPYAVSGTLSSEYSLYFLHRNEAYEHFIGIVHELHEFSRIYWDIDSSVVEMTPSGGVAGVVNSVEQNGNMLIFVTDSTTYYALFRNGSYTWYGELPDLVPLEWNCFEEHELYRDNDTGDPNKRGINYREELGAVIIHEKDEASMLQDTNALIGISRGRLNKYYIETEKPLYDEKSGDFGGLFFDAFFVRYAYRLFDDTTVKLSPPILIMPSRSILDLTRLKITIQFGLYEAGKDKKAKARIWVAGILTGGWGAAIEVLQQNTSARLEEDRSDVSIDRDNSNIYTVGFIPGIKYDLSSLSDYEGLIKGIDIFISPYVGINQFYNINTDVISEAIDNGSSWDFNSQEVRLVNGFNSEMIKRVTDMSSFYLVKSLEIGDTTGGVYVPFPEKTDTEAIAAINNLVHKEQLVDDTQSIHRVGAAKSFMYNHRLHLADITTTFFGGFSKQYFGWEQSNLGGTYQWCYNGKGPVFTYSGGTWDADDDLIVETELKYGSEQGRAYSFYRDVSYGFLSAMLSYPHSGATRMTFYWVDHVTGDIWRIGSFPLKDHEFLDISYYLDANLDGIFLDQFSSDAVRLTADEAALLLERAGVPFTVRMPNELRVAETYNPLRFLNRNVYPVGTGRIRSMGSNVMDVAAYNYGQFPLYVFTTDGVFSLRVGEGTTAYSVVTQPAFTEPVASDVTCQIPAGVLFLTARGLFLINGRKVEFLSGSIEELPVDLRFERSSDMDGVLPEMKELPRMHECTRMIYNNYKHEVLIVNPSWSFNWVLCLSDGSFYMSTERISNVVRNSMPNLVVMSGRDVLDFSREEGMVHVSFVTRPLSYGTQDIKMMERMILRGTFESITNYELGITRQPVVVTHRSNDGRNFLCSKGMFMKTGDLKDFDTGLYGRTKFRFYTFSLGMVCSPETVIEFIESEAVKEYDNTKMR